MRINSLLTTSRIVFLVALAVATAGCRTGSRNNSSLTGWTDRDKIAAGFDSRAKFKDQQTPPGMVFVEGGSFTMGSSQDDVLFDWNSAPVKQQVRSFYMDEAEVTNAEYLFYTEWVKKVFPPDQYEHVYKSTLPDTLVWRNVLGSNELLTENYLRHPAYADYPVVGVSWQQANDYCRWRTNRLNEMILIKRKVLNPTGSAGELSANGQNHFDTDVYLADPNAFPNPNAQQPGNRVKISDGILSPKFRLPTETEWEYAAKAEMENREYNTIRGRKKYAWNGKHTRNKGKRLRGDQLANFKQGKGDYSGLAGWSNDGAAITNKVKSYPPNAFGLYDMSGNVAEWVADVYRPIVNNETSDLNYFRGNIFSKKAIGEDGKLVIYTDGDIAYDTLANGKITISKLPGSLRQEPISDQDAYMRTNYSRADNINANDGDWASTKNFREEDIDATEEQRMYNAPTTDGVEKVYDSKQRSTLIGNDVRVFKGGSWKDRAYWMDASQRRYLPEYMATNFIGFRCATDRLGTLSQTNKKKPVTTKR
ncbi:MAG: gliding motility lipoprotein GldJ [Lutibacter sp.]|jgi:gliding motility-associated lipoprotein GldJ|nr:gliding motility lipoprotein GldJ [Lutibacter sp.]